MRSLLLALQFLTRVPITLQGEISPQDMARSTALFPAVGALLGLASAGAWLLAAQLWEPSVAAWIALLVPLGLTGALHLDGLMDTADGLLSGRSRERMLEIMRDSRVGAMGVTAGVLFLLGYYASINALPHSLVPRALIIAPTVGRWSMVVAILRYPYARRTGTGRPFVSVGWREVAVGGILTATLVWLALGWLGLLAAVAATAVGLLVATRLAVALGGLTGDTYGAVNLITELSVLLLVASRWMTGR